MRRIRKIVYLLFVSAILQSCYYYNEEELYPSVGDCDTTNVTYSGTIAIIMAENCNACHPSGFPQGNVVTDNYTDLKTVADNGRLWGAINHAAEFTPMPQNLPKLSDCKLNKIKTWLDNGALND